MATENRDPDGLPCYEDHAHDIAYRRFCDMCGSDDPNIVGHVLPDTPRIKGMDPVDAAAKVLATGASFMFDGILLDLFSASAIDAVYKAFQRDENKARLRAMSLPQAADFCFRLLDKVQKKDT